MDDHTAQVLDQLTHAEDSNVQLRQSIAARIARAREGESLPKDLPPRLPQPEYAVTSNLINRDIESLNFLWRVNKGTYRISRILLSKTTQAMRIVSSA